MEPVLPTWFKQRQGKAEPAGDNRCRLTAPNMPEAFIGIRPGADGRWAAALGAAADGPELAVTDAAFDTPGDAWGAAFELYRTRLVV